MQARLKYPAKLLPDAFPLLMQLNGSARRALPAPARDLAFVRVSQIDGCSCCLDTQTKGVKQVGEIDERLNLVAVWRDADCFNQGERAALALTEAATRLSDRRPGSGRAMGGGQPPFRRAGARVAARTRSRPCGPTSPSVRRNSWIRPHEGCSMAFTLTSAERTNQLS